MKKKETLIWLKILLVVNITFYVVIIIGIFIGFNSSYDDIAKIKIIYTFKNY